MEVLRFEVWRESTKVKDTEYEAPLSREEALDALQAENSCWIGKLTVKDSKVGLRGPHKLDPSKTYVLQVADLAGSRPCPYMRKAIFQWSLPSAQSTRGASLACAHPAHRHLQPCPQTCLSRKCLSRKLNACGASRRCINAADDASSMQIVSSYAASLLKPHRDIGALLDHGLDNCSVALLDHITCQACLA